MTNQYLPEYNQYTICPMQSTNSSKEIEMEKIKVVVIDDMDDINEYFRVLLHREQDIEVIGSATGAREGFEVIKRMQPDIVLTDIEMETPDAGIQLIKKVSLLYPEIRCIVLTIHDEDSTLFDSFEAGAKGFIVKTASASEILHSIRSVYLKQISVDEAAIKRIIFELCRLKGQQENIRNILSIIMQITHAEFEILKDLYNGYTYKEVAAKRMVEEVTIRSQCASILKKFDARRMKDLINDLHDMAIFDLLEEPDQNHTAL